MIHYILTLFNKDHSLIQKRQEIRKVFDRIRNGGKSGHSFKDFDNYDVTTLKIENDRIEIDVQESGTSWHPWVGRILANKHAMRQYCHGMSLNHMFKWIRHTN